MLAGRVSLVVDGEAVSQALIRAVWTDDEQLSTRISREVAHYTGQAELAEAIQEGLEARKAGDEDDGDVQAGPRGPAGRRRAATTATMKLLRGWSSRRRGDRDGAPQARQVDDVDEMALDTRSTKTVRVTQASDRPNDRDPTHAARADHERARRASVTPCSAMCECRRAPGATATARRCGFDFVAAAPRATAARRRWELVIVADRRVLRRASSPADIGFPRDAAAARSIALDARRVRIGRRPVRAPTRREIDTSPTIPRVSRLHASLVRQDDGSWAIVDEGSRQRHDDQRTSARSPHVLVRSTTATASTSGHGRRSSLGAGPGS